MQFAFRSPLSRATVGISTTLLGGTVLLLVSQCGVPAQPGEANLQEPPDWSQVKGPKALFLLPEDVERPLYLIHDPLLGSEIPLEDGWKVYRFDQSGVLRVRWFEEMRLPKYWLRAITDHGHELDASWSSYGGGPNSLSMSTWDINEFGERHFFEYPNWTKPEAEQLRLRGFTDLDRTPAHQALIAADPHFTPKEGSRVEKDPLPRFASDSVPTPRFVVSDGYSGPIYLITDPRNGSPPRRLGDEEIYSFPDDGVLRVQLTEDQSRNPAWPLVFERSGGQLWLRAIRSSNAGFKHLPISAFLVCRTEEEIPNFEGRDTKTPYEQLLARGIPDLGWE